jgi:hypothetical protein
VTVIRHNLKVTIGCIKIFILIFKFIYWKHLEITSAIGKGVPRAGVEWLSWEDLMTRYRKLVGYFSGTVATALLGAVSFVPSSPAAAAGCQGPGAPATTQTRCVKAILIPGNPLQSYDISFVNPHRAEYYLADRSNSGIDIIDTRTLTFKRRIGGFVGLKFKGTAADNAHSGPDGVVTHGRWLYAGDGDSTLKVIDLDAPTATAIKQIFNTGGTTRVDEMDLTTDGKLLLVANNAEDPPFGTLFHANGDAAVSNVSKIAKITVSTALLPAGQGLGIEQPAWDPTTKRFYTSIPTILGNPAGCTLTGPVFCSGGLLVTDPTLPAATLAIPAGLFNPATGTGVIPLPACGPNGATVGVNDNLLLGCTPGNFPPQTTTLVINAKTHNSAAVNGITGSDEVWFNKGDSRYYLGASKAIKPAGSPLGSGAVLGVVDATSVLIETIPQSSGSHSVAADSKRNLIFVPQNFTAASPSPPTTANAGTDTNTTAGPGSPTVGQRLCGSSSGCVVVYRHDDDEHEEERLGDIGHDSAK